jgi:hypothetical protein
MTAQVARVVASVLTVAVTAGCTHYFEIPIETPIRAKLDVTPFQRVLVAGFITGGTDDLDANVETTRLLRSQLRTKSELSVIDADTLPLMDVATGRDEAPAAAEFAPIRNEDDLKEYEAVFANVNYWKQIGEEFQQPLIVTGTVMFSPQELSQRVVRPREVYDQFGRRQVTSEAVFMERKGFVLRPRFIFIDGRDGTVMHSETFKEEILYPATNETPALSSYFELMDRLIPSFLGTLSSQKVKGTRFLIQ